MAYLDVALVDSIFKVNLFDIEENQQWFYQMLGLGDHTPFECIGQIQEVQLAFELCKRKGVTGKAVQMYMHHFSKLEHHSIVDKYLRVNMEETCIPDTIAKILDPQFQILAVETRRSVMSLLN